MGFFNQIKTHPVRFAKSCGLFTCFLTIGLSLGIVGPSLLDFSDKTHKDLKFVALILPFRAGGYAVGSFISGLIYQRIDFQICASITMGFSAAFTIAIPFVVEIWTLLVCFMIVGFCLGLFSAGKFHQLESSVLTQPLSSAGNIWVLDLWGKGEFLLHLLSSFNRQNKPIQFSPQKIRPSCKLFTLCMDLVSEEF